MSALKVIPDDASAIRAEIAAAYEGATGKTLYPAQVESLLVDLIAYRETLLRAAINDAARQNLVRFARSPMLDYLGELVGVARLPGEDDERLRSRILEAPESFSVAGPRLAYRHHAMSADSSIVDVAVTSPEPGVVRLYPLTATGLPSADIKTLVLAKASAEDVRPLCDTVEVADPIDMSFIVDARLTVLQQYDAETVRQQALAAVITRCNEIASRLGRDVARSALIAALHVEGVASVRLVAPNADISVPETAWAHATSISLTVEGVSHG
ncbi:baseplate assembly protein [Pelomicrobium methylotrophicum]|uniref:Phage tail protein n=1 Tax=Pelomicrobium methylotrophicum TaxID=2602750 RepID=A0A5C7EIQ7_9PROT|nr:baseplate J/gp47 family protein [Pelomicrobium methylotrophicum]TXF11939.1 phage tail protein [Pelomicrobium methylotrophicum]